MEKKIIVKSVNVSEKKGTIKKPVENILLSEIGVDGDAHSGLWHRQVSMLAVESILRFEKIMKRKINPGEFAENITSEGIEIKDCLPFDKFIGENIELEVTQIGKKCHGSNCAIFNETGNCVMPKEGIFLKVIKGGKLIPGDELNYHQKKYKILILTLSDRASRGEYDDLSGKIINEMLLHNFEITKRKSEINKIIIPDDSVLLKQHVNNAVENNYDAIFTTGGTGIGIRDITVDAIKPLLTKEIPGIMENIRVKFGSSKPNALLSRSVAGLINNTFIYTLPGSVKAVDEYMTEILKTFEHLFLMLHGIDAH